MTVRTSWVFGLPHSSRPLTYFLVAVWWARQASNLQPTDYELEQGRFVDEDEAPETQ